MNTAEKWHGTTIVLLRKNGETVVAGDGQVSLGNTVLKSKAKKVRKIESRGVIAGFAGSTADALTLFERLEAKLEKHAGNLQRAAVELAKDWRSDKFLRRLEALMAVADKKHSFIISGTGDVLEPEDGIIGIGSGGNYALAAAKVLAETDMSAEDIARKSIKAASDKITAMEGSASQLIFDVTDRQAAEDAINGFEQDTGPIDILINNAGMQHRQPLEEFDPAAFDRVTATNVTALFTLSQLVARHMIERKQGKIINIASVMTKAARHMIGAYTTSKAAVAGLTRAMTAEWAQHGIGCNAIGPGYFSTELTSALFNQEEFASWLRKRTPAGRWGEVDDLVGAALFLSAPASNYVNGHVLYVDGGMTATIG